MPSASDGYPTNTVLTLFNGSRVAFVSQDRLLSDLSKAMRMMAQIFRFVDRTPMCLGFDDHLPLLLRASATLLRAESRGRAVFVLVEDFG